MLDSSTTVPTTDLLSVEQIAQEMHFHKETIRNHIRKGTLRAMKFGRDYRIDPRDYESYRAMHYTTG